MNRENSSWGAPAMHGELLMLGISGSRSDEEVTRDDGIGDF
jgi:hypothetical protein